MVTRIQYSQNMKPCFGFQWVLQDPDLGVKLPHTNLPPKKPNAPMEPGSHKEALLNFKVAILLGHMHHLSLAHQDLVLADVKRVLLEHSWRTPISLILQAGERCVL